MGVLIILISVFLLFILQENLYLRYWNLNMAAKAEFSEKAIIEGETIIIKDELVNDKLLPLPWVHFKYQIKNGSETAFFESELFHILFHQRIQVKRTRVIPKRGIYRITGIDLVSYDLLLTKKLVSTVPCTARLTVYPALIDVEDIIVFHEKLMGDLITRCFTNEDPYQFRSIRDYQFGDEFKRINFKASAKAGYWQVNTYEYTREARVLFVLLCDRTSNLSNENEYERALHLAGTLASIIEAEGIPVALVSNGLVTETGRELFVPAGCGTDHLETIMEALAGLNTRKIQRPCAELLSELEAKTGKNDYYVLISPYRREELILRYLEMQMDHIPVSWISPLSKDRLLAEDEFQNLSEKLPGFAFDMF